VRAPRARAYDPTMRTSRLLIVAVSVVALLGAACSDDDSKDASATTTTQAAAPAGPQNYSVVVDGPSKLGAENLVFGIYFPKTVSVRPGDTVVFDNRSSNDVHTVSFGVKSDRSDQPAVILKTGSENPAVFKPCFTTEPVRPDMTSCTPPVAGTPEFTGKGFWNAGVLLPTALPAEAGPKTTTVKLAAAVTPGAYTVTCLLHPFMESTLQVVGSDAERQTPAQVAAAADRELGQAKAAAAGLAAPTEPPVADGATVVAGWGDKLTGVNRFSPETVSIKVGQKVTWRDHSPFLPHTVSFQPPFAGPSEPGAMLPVGAKSGSRFAGGVAHSGIFGPSPPFPVDSFSLTFTKAGKYAYGCLLHPGMAGTVEVS
jgi:plastocyanin